MLPSHVAGGYWLQAPFGLAISSRTRACGVVLACDGEEWKTTWLVRSANNGSLSGGWRGFAVDQRLAVGDALTFTKEPVFACASPSTAPVVRSRDDDDDDAARDAAREAAFAEAAAHTDALFANHGAKPGAAVTVAGAPDPLPGCGTAVRSHVYSRRREGRRDAAASAAARARAAASPDACAEMAARADFDVDVDVHLGELAADRERVEDGASPAPATLAGAQLPFASPRAAAHTRTNANVATPANTTDALGSPACTPAPPPRAARAGADQAAALAAARAPLRPGASRRVEPAPLETPASPFVVGAPPPSSSRRGDVAALPGTVTKMNPDPDPDRDLDRDLDRDPDRDREPFAGTGSRSEAGEARAKKRPGDKPRRTCRSRRERRLWRDGTRPRPLDR